MATMEIAPNHDLLTIPGSRVSVLFHCGALEELGKLAAGLGGSRAVVISDPGIAAAGYLRRALDALRRAGLTAAIFDQVGENPTTDHVEAGVAVARDFRPDLLVGLGGGSAMDCAKGINFLLTNGGQMQDYWGHNKASRPMLPLIAIPTTAGTGSEAQSYALITDPQTHQKMACGDDKALSRIAILDAELTATTPPAVAAAAGIDALAHAIESSASTRRNDTSRPLSAEAWRRLIEAYPRIIRDRDDVEARQQMHLGAHLSGAAIENSMLGAAHACANALTARFGTTHGVAVGAMLPAVIRYNAAAGINPYLDLMSDAEELADRVEAMKQAAGLPDHLRELGASEHDLPDLAEFAARQWTATFNPRPVGAAELERIFASAL